MTVKVNIAEYAEVPGVARTAGGNPFGVIQFPGPLIDANDVDVDGTQAVAFNGQTKYCLITAYDGSVNVATAVGNGTPLGVGKGPPILMGNRAALLRTDGHAYILIRERT